MTRPINDISQDKSVESGPAPWKAAAGEYKASASSMPSRKSRKRRSNEPANKPGEQSSGRRSSPRPRLAAEWKTHAGVLVVAALLTFAAYANALESLLPRIESAVTPDELIVWWYLGELYMEQGHTEQARTAYQEYLGRAIGTDDSKVVRLRGLASQALNNLKQ
jgi:predicted Zn-dependent protease